MASAPVQAVKNVVNSAVSTVTGAAASTSPTQELTEAESTTDTSGVVSPASKDAKSLERKLSLRPDRSELVEKNILKNSNAAPSLQAAQAELARARLEDQLESKLQARPTPEELVKEGILSKDEIPGA